MEVRPVGVSKGDSTRRLLNVIAESEAERVGRSSLPEVDFVLVAGETSHRVSGGVSGMSDLYACCLVHVAGAVQLGCGLLLAA